MIRVVNLSMHLLVYTKKQGRKFQKNIEIWSIANRQGQGGLYTGNRATAKFPAGIDTPKWTLCWVIRPVVEHTIVYCKNLWPQWK